MKKNKLKFCSAATMFAGLCCFVFTVQAAEKPEKELKVADLQKTEQYTYGLEPVVVTARKRPEKLQEVPISITTITKNEIINTGLKGMDKVMMMTPGLFGMQSPQSTSSAFNIRGVGTLGGGSGWEDGTISAYVDGVPIPIGQLDNYMLDIMQIEVLRGPQGTLFGKTALGGVINITTIPPSSVFEASLGGTLGTLGRHGANAMVTGPIIDDKLNARLFVNMESRDGVIENIATGDNLGDIDRLYGRVSLEAFWTDSFNSRLNISYDKLDNNDNIFVMMDGFNQVDTNESLFEKRDTFSIGLINKVALTDAVMLNLVTGLNIIDFHSRTLQPGVAGALLDIQDTEYHFNQEIRLDSEIGKLEWTTGLFGSYFKRDIYFVPDGKQFINEGKQTATSMAVFGEGTYALTNTFKLTAGLRLNQDKRSVDETVTHQGFSPFVMPFTNRMDEDKTYEDWNGRVVLTYIPSENHTLFASISRGYKPGGYQMYHNTAMVGLDRRTPDFSESTSVSSELGYKGLFLDQRIGFDASVFYITTEGENILGFSPTTMQSIFYNVDSKSYGFELSSKARITKGLTLGGNLAIIRAVLTEDKLLFPAFPMFGMPDETWVYKDAQLPNVPRYSYHLFMEYSQAMSVFGNEMSGFMRADYGWQSKIWFDATHVAQNDPYGVFNLRAGMENNDFRIIVYGDNLTDEEYFTYGMGAGAMEVGFPARGREVGVKLTMFF